MNGPEILSQARDRLSQTLRSRETPAAEPLDISKWLAMSLLQKTSDVARRDWL